MKTSMVFLVFMVFAIAFFYFGAMVTIEFVTWGDAIWNMAEWSDQERAAFGLGATLWGVISFFWITRD